MANRIQISGYQILLKNFSLICFVFVYFQGISQNTDSSNHLFQKKNNINVDLGGYGVIGSIGYERILINSNKFKTTGQVGGSVFSFPVTVNQLVSFNNHHMEFGLGIILPTTKTYDPYFSGSIGYRFQKPTGRYLFRARLMPVVLEPDKELGAGLILWVWPCLTFGKVF